MNSSLKVWPNGKLMPLKSSGTVYKLDAAASNTLASTDDANANNNMLVHTDDSIENTLRNDKGLSGGDTNKKGEPVKGITLNAEGLGKEGQDGIAFTEISQEKGEEVGYLRIIASLDCTDVFILNSTIQQCFLYSYQQASAEEMLVKGEHVEVRVAHQWY